MGVTSAGVRMTGDPLRELPPPPDWMRPDAARRYAEAGEYLVSMGCLTAGELPLLERYASTYGRWIEAERFLAELDDGVGYHQLLNRNGEPASAVALPAQAAASKAHDQLRQLESALGLTPTDRARLPVRGTGGTPTREEALVAEMFGEVA